MARLNYNRPNGGYEMEPWDRRRFRDQKTKNKKYKNKVQAESLNDTINKETVFIRGKYHGKDIGQVLQQDPGYGVWILDNQPRGIVAQQIMKYYNKQ
jgi:hypothetical protein